MQPIHFNRFDRDMSRATGVKVHWEDREFFRIEKPEADTVVRLIDFLENYRWRFGYDPHTGNDLRLVKEGTYDVTAKGTLELHGVSRERTLKGKLTISNGQLILVSDFDVRLTDHKIEVPTLVMAKVAELSDVIG
ncbi:hypothetical protein QNI16_36000 [Cytophagaceae bacterium YF14B1]|uniref:Uncharacterized protein n=1 Tax=Xanthocytophaga flava TaxID=3048013 RepID=A0AAE3QV36_9BACT|nr:hypothetical protein [Xanthocytophaga flavus]MDJ1485940.1 hypothetical protein [Xanthocytophaga flavus]